MAKTSLTRPHVVLISRVLPPLKEIHEVINDELMKHI